MADQGKIALTLTFTLKSVLYVPKLLANLLSIHQITKDLNYTVTFFQSHCVIQDRATTRTIEHAKENEGLYVLGSSFGNGVRMPLSHFSKMFSLNKSPNMVVSSSFRASIFSLLKKKFPLLFNKLDVNSFHCEVCQLAKHHRVPFPLSNTKLTFPFLLFHTDVWGPS